MHIPWSLSARLLLVLPGLGEPGRRTAHGHTGGLTGPAHLCGAVDMCWSHPPILLKLSFWSPRSLWEGEVPGPQAGGGGFLEEVLSK